MLVFSLAAVLYLGAAAYAVHAIRSPSPARPNPFKTWGQEPAVITTVVFARDQVGKRYVLGGSGPDEWDASGLVATAYFPRLPRTVAEQGLQGTAVLLSDVEPGDLLFWGSPVAYHVAIATGPTTYIAAESTALGVAALDWSDSRPDFARRVS